MKKHDSAPHIVMPERKFRSIKDVFKLYKAKVGFLHGFKEDEEQDEDEEESKYTPGEDTGSYVNAESLEVPQYEDAFKEGRPYNAQWQGYGSPYYLHGYPMYQGR